MDGSNDSLSILTAPMSGSAAVLLTPGRTRNIAQDMETLRLSRQDNPFLQQVIKASRESLIESHIEDDCESDDTILMSQDFGSSALDFVEEDPLTLKEVHEHMIRSPPPTSCWSNDPLSCRASSAFDFGADSPVSFSAYSVAHEKESVGLRARSPRRARPRPARSASPRSHDAAARPLSLPGESHLRNALGKRSQPERFSLLQHPRPLRRPLARRTDDSVQLVPHCDNYLKIVFEIREDGGYVYALGSCGNCSPNPGVMRGGLMHGGDNSNPARCIHADSQKYPSRTLLLGLIHEFSTCVKRNKGGKAVFEAVISNFDLYLY